MKSVTKVAQDIVNNKKAGPIDTRGINDFASFGENSVIMKAEDFGIATNEKAEDSTYWSPKFVDKDPEKLKLETGLAWAKQEAIKFNLSLTKQVEKENEYGKKEIVTLDKDFDELTKELNTLKKLHEHANDLGVAIKEEDGSIFSGKYFSAGDLYQSITDAILAKETFEISTKKREKLGDKYNEAKNIINDLVSQYIDKKEALNAPRLYASLNNLINSVTALKESNEYLTNTLMLSVQRVYSLEKELSQIKEQNSDTDNAVNNNKGLINTLIKHKTDDKKTLKKLVEEQEIIKQGVTKNRQDLKDITSYSKAAARGNRV